MIRSHISVLPAEDREQAYTTFKSFLNESNKGGNTLISSAPVRFPGTKSLAAKRAYYTRLAFKPDIKVAAISLLVPPEICWASGFLPFNWEMFSSLLASHSKIIELTNRGTAPVPRCSFINSLKGACHSGILPAPDIMISSTAFCEGISHMFGELSDNLGKQHFHIDINGYLNDISVKSLSLYLTEIFKEMCWSNDLSISDGEKNLRKVMYHSTMAKNEYLQICNLRKQNAPLDLGLEPLHWHFLFSAMWGEESGYHVCKKLKEDIINEIQVKRQHKNGTGLPISIFSLIPYGHSDIWNKMNESNVYTAFEGVNFIGDYLLPDMNAIEDMSLDDLMQNIAYNLINTPMRGLDIEKKSRDFMRNALESGAKGMLIFTHEHCQMLAPRLDEVEKAATAVGLKLTSISGDCILGMPQGPANIRLGTFISSLSQEKNKIQIHTENDQEKKKEYPFFRSGIDFGSGFSKYVVIDGANNLVNYGILSSGIDYPKLLNQIKERITNSNRIEFAIAGVGGDNPGFKNLVRHQTTEINALIKAVNFLYYKEQNYTVIDIGTQDVKVLKFTGNESNPWINTNKSCGAGTGMVLVQILERWQQTNQGIRFDDLDQMAFEAANVELINTTCGIFAVTNVVSALVQSNEARRKDILRGVYEYIAEQAIKLLPGIDKQGGRVILTGGLARHKTLQKIFAERGFELIPLPEDIHPQFVVAYGTALSLGL